MLVGFALCFCMFLAAGRCDEAEALDEQPECSAEQCQAIVDQLPASLAEYAGCTAQCVVMVPLVGYDEASSKPTIIAVKDGELHEALEELGEDGEPSKRLRLGRKLELNDREKRPSFIRIGKRPSFIRIGRSSSVSRLLRLGKRPSFIRIGK